MSDWRKKGIILFLVLLLLFIGTSCSKKNNNDEEEKHADAGVEKTEDIKTVEQSEIEGVASPLSGIYAEEEKVNRRPFAVVFDNQPGARPQAGLIDAEFAYEFLAEGDITRYLGIFLINEPENLGPIRSARPYLVEKSLEFDSHLVHVGGSNQAIADIENKKVANINSMSRGNDVFWRKGHKKIPHNLYSSYEALKKAAEKSNYRKEPQFDGFKFNPSFKEMGKGEIANEVKVKYFKSSEASYIYDDANKIYKRYYNGTEHKDEITEETLTATNIIIQQVSAKVIDEQLRLKMDTVGEGKGTYITGGKAIDITWKKGSYEGATKYYDETGQELILNPGKTWVQVVRNFNGVTIEE